MNIPFSNSACVSVWCALWWRGLERIESVRFAVLSAHQPADQSTTDQAMSRFATVEEIQDEEFRSRVVEKEDEWEDDGSDAVRVADVQTRVCSNSH